MKKLFVAVAVAALLLAAAADAQRDELSETVFGSEELLIGVTLAASFELVPESSDYDTEYARVNLTLFPREDEYQSVSFTKIEPKAKSIGESIVLEWEKPKAGKHEFAVSADVASRVQAVPVRSKVSFPITQLDQGLAKYTMPSQTIDSDNDAIVQLASSLAAGEDDLYEVVYKLAAWSNQNIEYNLSTLTAEVSKPSSWVLTNRQGVCDELTNLFIALNRALGIPARFVSGVSYTDSPLFPERWGFHGWAEVYFPGYGWVPFDVTYGEFGFVDAGHIKLIETVDAEDTTTNYRWSGRNIGLQTSKLEQSTEVRGSGGEIKPDVMLRARMLKDVVGFGSYNIEEVEIENLRDEYVIAQLTHSITESTELIGSSRREILLKPGEKKREYFAFKVSDALNEGFEYTFPMSVSAYRAKAEAGFKANSGARQYSLEEVNELRIEEEDSKEYSRNVEVSCVTDRKEIYIYEETEITCNVRNTGNVALNNLAICHEQKCERLFLGITRSRKFDLTARFDTPGLNRAKVSVESDSVSKTEAVEVKVIDVPSIKISEVSHPEKVKYDENYEITFLAEPIMSTPYNVEIEVGGRKAFEFEKLDQKKKLTAEMRASGLDEGENRIEITATFRDGNDRSYSTTEETTVEVDKINFLQRIKRFFLRLFS